MYSLVFGSLIEWIPHTTWATVNIMDTGAALRMDIGSYSDDIRGLSKSIYRIPVLWAYQSYGPWFT